MVFDADNPPIPPDAVFVPSRPIFALRVEWHRSKRAGIAVRPWREVCDEFVAQYLAERERAGQRRIDPQPPQLDSRAAAVTPPPIPMPYPRLIDVAPELATELQHLLLRRDEAALAGQVAGLILVDLCGCGDSFCASFYTTPRSVAPSCWQRRTIPLQSDSGILTVDVIDLTIVYVEVLYRDDLRRKMHMAVA